MALLSRQVTLQSVLTGSCAEVAERVLSRALGSQSSLAHLWPLVLPVLELKRQEPELLQDGCERQHPLQAGFVSTDLPHTAP